MCHAGESCRALTCADSACRVRTCLDLAALPTACRVQHSLAQALDTFILAVILWKHILLDILHSPSARNVQKQRVLPSQHRPPIKLCRKGGKIDNRASAISMRSARRKIGWRSNTVPGSSPPSPPTAPPRNEKLSPSYIQIRSIREARPRKHDHAQRCSRYTGQGVHRCSGVVECMHDELLQVLHAILVRHHPEGARPAALTSFCVDKGIERSVLGASCAGHGWGDATRAPAIAWVRGAGSVAVAASERDAPTELLTIASHPASEQRFTCTDPHASPCAIPTARPVRSSPLLTAALLRRVVL